MFSTTFHVISRKLDCFSNSVRSSVFLINKNKLGYTCYCRLNGMIQGSVSKKCAFLFEWELQLNNLVTPDKWPCLNCAEIFEFFFHPPSWSRPHKQINRQLRPYLSAIPDSAESLAQQSHTICHTYCSIVALSLVTKLAQLWFFIIRY